MSSKSPLGFMGFILYNFSRTEVGRWGFGLRGVVSLQQGFGSVDAGKRGAGFQEAFITPAEFPAVVRVILE